MPMIDPKEWHSSLTVLDPSSIHARSEESRSIGDPREPDSKSESENEPACGRPGFAIDADTKLIPCWMLGQRDPITARAFMEDLAPRLASPVQLTTDGLKAYLTDALSKGREFGGSPCESPCT